jgi:hypothetical protein
MNLDMIYLGNFLLKRNVINDINAMELKEKLIRKVNYPNLPLPRLPM